MTIHKPVARPALACLMALSLASAAVAAPSPQRAAQDFLAWHASTLPSGYPNDRELSPLRPLLTGELICLLKAAGSYSRKHQKAAPDEKPPYVEGDLFLSSIYERPASAEIEAIRVREGSASALVLFAYEEFSWRDRLQFRLSNGEWRLADIDRLGHALNHGKGFAFGGQAGSLVDALYADMGRSVPAVHWHRREVDACKATR
jgi:hypothetical protein